MKLLRFGHADTPLLREAFSASPVSPALETSGVPKPAAGVVEINRPRYGVVVVAEALDAMTGRVAFTEPTHQPISKMSSMCSQAEQPSGETWVRWTA
jgi:hypothetical protein